MRTIENIKKDLIYAEREAAYHENEFNFWTGKVCGLKTELKEAEEACKPKPKHGDICLINNSFKVIVVADTEGLGGFSSYGSNGNGKRYEGKICSVPAGYNSGRYVVIGNVFNEN